MALVDIDGLKTVNEHAGHAAGDAVILDVGRALTSSLRSYDLIVRYDDDEFLCALSGSSVADTAARLAQAVSVLEGLPSAASVSVGLAELRAGESLEALVGRADADLYEKRSRRQA